MADLNERRECVHCGTPNPAHWTVCGNCGRDPWRASETPAEAQPPSRSAAASSEGDAPHATTYVVMLPDFTELTVPAGERLTVGRETDDPVIDGALEPYLDVSRIHLSFEATDSGPVVTDVGSTYGTWLDGERLEVGAAVPLTPGQRLRLGKNCYLKVITHGD